MICNTIGLTTDSFETLYVRGGADVPEVYGSINYAQPIFYSLKTLTGATSYSFMGYSEPLKSYEISGNMVQNGTPTPASPINPQECGDRTENLLNNDSIVSGGWSASEGTNPEPIANYRRCRYSNFFAVASKNILYDFKDLSVNIVMMGSDGLSLGGTGFLSGIGSVTLLSNTEKISLIIAKSNPDESITVEYARSKNISVDYGYKLPLTVNSTTQNIYLSEPLRKIESYADSISSDGTVTRRIQKLVLTGEEGFELYPSAGLFGVRLSISDMMYNGRTDGVCTHFTPLYTPSGATTDSIVFGANSRFLFITLSQSTIDTYSISDVSSFRSYLAAQYAAGTPVTIWYVLSVPIAEQVTAPTLTPVTGSNALAIGTTLQPSSVSITGHVKPSS